MATVTSCPSCSEKLRLPDAMLGQKVRCPQCSNIFTAGDSSASTPVERGPGVEAPLLLLPSSSETARTPPVGAREFNLSLDDSSPQLPTLPPPPESEPLRREASPPDRPSSRSGRTRDDEGDEEQIRCPVCRRKNEAAARRCYHCGERLLDSPRRSGGYPDRDRYDDDWQPRRRRDTIPHRGGLVLAMGIVSLVMLVVFTGLGLPFGLVGWWLGQVDLRKIRDKQMDPEGEGMTRHRLDSQHHRHGHEWPVHPWLRRLFRVHYHGCGVCQHAEHHADLRAHDRRAARAVQHQAPAQSVGERSEQGFPEGQVSALKELAGSTSVAVPICQPRLRG